jgi:hypothetical protein
MLHVATFSLSEWYGQTGRILTQEGYFVPPSPTLQMFRFSCTLLNSLDKNGRCDYWTCLNKIECNLKALVISISQQQKMVWTICVWYHVHLSEPNNLYLKYFYSIPMEVISNDQDKWGLCIYRYNTHIPIYIHQIGPKYGYLFYLLFI